MTDPERPLVDRLLSLHPARWSDVWGLIASDRERMYGAMGTRGSRGQRLFWWFLPESLALWFYRIYRCLYLNGWRNLAWLLYLANVYLTRAEIPPTTEIGHSCLIGHPTGCRLAGRIGARATILGGDSGTGGGMGDDGKDVGGGAGVPWIGDDVVIGVGALVLGPVRIGHGVRIGPRAVVSDDLADGALVMWTKPRVMQGGAGTHLVA